MKIKIKSIISVMLAIILAVSVCTVMTFMFTGCGEPVDENFDKRVYSNGGSVVEYGDYVYFINGMAEFPAENSKDEHNVNGKIKRGALYRVKKHDAVLSGGADPSLSAGATEKEIADYNSYKEQEYIDFVSSEKNWKDLGNYYIADYHDITEDGKEVPHYEHSSNETEYHIDVEGPIISKMIGVSTYRAGFYIFDDRIYFGSPSVTLDKDGNYQYSKIDFYTYSISSKILTKLYTTTAGVDGEKIKYIPYNFSKQNGKVYLTTYEQWYASDKDEEEGKLTGYIVTIPIVNGVAGEQVLVAKNVLAAYFPTKENYHPDDSTNTIDDFVYFIRKATREDDNNYGLVIEMMRPNGEDRTIIINNGQEATIEGISGGFFYYRNKRFGKQTLEYTNLYDQLELSSYKKTVDKNGVMSYLVDETSKNFILKEGKTFISEQHEILAGYNAWVAADGNPFDSRYQKYLDEYVPLMTETKSIIIADTEDEFLKVSSILLMPFKACRDINSVRVIVTTESGIKSVGAGDNNTYQLNSSTITALTYYDGKIYGYDSNNTFTFMSATDSGTQVAGLNGNYSTVKSDSLIVMEILEVHDKNGKVVDTYAVYFTDYPRNEKATGYMAVLKVAGINNKEGLFAVPMAYVLPAERPVVKCYDPDCINYTHDHSERDGYTPGDTGEEPEGEEQNFA